MNRTLPRVKQLTKQKLTNQKTKLANEEYLVEYLLCGEIYILRFV